MKLDWIESNDLGLVTCEKCLEIARMNKVNKKPNFTGWLSGLGFDERQIRLISNCVDYKSNDPAGMPGHNLAIIVAKLTEILSQAGTMQNDSPSVDWDGYVGWVEFDAAGYPVKVEDNE